MFGGNRQAGFARGMGFGNAVNEGNVVEAVAAQGTDVRARFVSAVYGLLTVSVLFAIAGAWISATTGLKVWVMQNWLISLIIYFAAFAGVYLLRHRKPINLVMLYAFTFVTGVWIGPVAYMYPGPALNAGLATGLIFFGLTIYARTTKRDLTFLGGMLFVGLLAVFGMLILNMFFQSTALSFGISVAGVLLFSGFILYDTQMIMRRYPPEEYVSATLALYLDILNLFWFLLRIFLAFGDD